MGSGKRGVTMSLTTLETVKLSRAADLDIAARPFVLGAVLGDAFGNFYVITARPDAHIGRQVNLMKGRPADQVGSVTTTREFIPTLFDWDNLPDGLSRATTQQLIDKLFGLGPFGFRGPARDDIPD